MYIVGIHRGEHDATVCLLKDGEVVFNLQGERLSNIKYDKHAMIVLNEIKKYTNYIDYVAITGFKNYSTEDSYLDYLEGLGKTFKDHGFKVEAYYHNHHQIHAANAFYNSGFDKALCIVMDGLGSMYHVSDEKLNLKTIYGQEYHSVFKFSYPNNIELVNNFLTLKKENLDGMHQINDTTYINSAYSEGMAFGVTAYSFGFTEQDAGKIMGMAPYGKENSSIPDIYKNGVINRDLFTYIDTPGQVYHQMMIELDGTFEQKADFAYKLQKEVQEHVAKSILESLQKTNEKNLCLSGGFFLNCVSNYNLLKQLPEDINIYIEPMSGDNGNAIGAAKLLYHTLTKSTTKNPQSNIYYGPKRKYTLDDLSNEKTINVTAHDVAKLISEKNIVAIYQGGSESGPRALGNRSILYDPRDPNGKDHVNVVKKREWFRPFAGSVLKEHAKDWFDLVNLEESKFMMYAVDVLKDKQELIPAITHVDGTCRVQTVAEKDNKTFYNLINEFYNITKVPILFNTSFNLAGNAIVETLEDALWTLHNSKINYLYLPELEVLVTK